MVTLFNSDATAFGSNGLGAVVVYRCEITEEINGNFALEMEVAAQDADKITEGRIIVADTHRGRQPFRIHRTEKYLDQTVRVSARHLSYDLLGTMIEDRAPTSSTATSALNIALTGTPFTGSSAVGGTASARWIRKGALAAIMGDDDNSIVNRWGGEIERDGYTINLQPQIGQNRGVSIMYRKNLTGLAATVDTSNVVTRIYATGLKADGKTVLSLPEKYIDSPYVGSYPTIRATHVHYGDIKVGGDKYPTESAAIAAIRSAVAAEYAVGVDMPDVSLDVSFVDLSKTVEYKDYAQLEMVTLGDTVHCRHDALGIDVTLRAVTIRWDAITNRAAEITLGQPAGTIVQDINRQIKDVPKLIEAQRTALDDAIDSATQLITGNLGGNVVLHNSTGGSEPDEILIMDTEDITTATKVWRWNKAGLGYSSSGYGGPYGLAMTANGQIVADYIATGSLNAGLIKTGKISGTGDTDVYFDLDAGELSASVIRKSTGSAVYSLHLGASMSGEPGITLARNGKAYCTIFPWTGDVNAVWIQGPGDAYSGPTIRLQGDALAGSDDPSQRILLLAKSPLLSGAGSSIEIKHGQVAINSPRVVVNGTQI